MLSPLRSDDASRFVRLRLASGGNDARFSYCKLCYFVQLVLGLSSVQLLLALLLAQLLLALLLAQLLEALLLRSASVRPVLPQLLLAPLLLPQPALLLL